MQTQMWLDVVLVVGLVGTVAVGAYLVGCLMTAARAVEDQRSSALVIPKKDAAAVQLARHLMNNVNQRFFNSFVALPNDERLDRDGVRLAYIHKKFCFAITLLDEAQEVVRGHKILTLADREAREAAIQLAEITHRVEPGKISGPMAGQEPTHH